MQRWCRPFPICPSNPSFSPSPAPYELVFVNGSAYAVAPSWVQWREASAEDPHQKESRTGFSRPHVLRGPRLLSTNSQRQLQPLARGFQSPSTHPSKSKAGEVRIYCPHLRVLPCVSLATSLHTAPLKLASLRDPIWACPLLLPGCSSSCLVDVKGIAHSQQDQIKMVNVSWLEWVL